MQIANVLEPQIQDENFDDEAGRTKCYDYPCLIFWEAFFRDNWVFYPMSRLFNTVVISILHLFPRPLSIQFPTNSHFSRQLIFWPYTSAQVVFFAGEVRMSEKWESPNHLVVDYGGPLLGGSAAYLSILCYPAIVIAMQICMTFCNNAETASVVGLGIILFISAIIFILYSFAAGGGGGDSGTCSLIILLLYFFTAGPAWQYWNHLDDAPYLEEHEYMQRLEEIGREDWDPCVEDYEWPHQALFPGFDWFWFTPMFSRIWGCILWCLTGIWWVIKAIVWIIIFILTLPFNPDYMFTQDWYIYVGSISFLIVLFGTILKRYK